MTQINDQVIPEVAEDFGAETQVSSGQLLPNIQSTADVQVFRRVLRTTRNTVVTDGITTTINYTFLNEVAELRRFFHVRIRNVTATILRVVATLQRGTSGQLIMEPLNASMAASRNNQVVGPGFRNPGAAGNGDFMPDEILQPENSSLIFKVTANVGGAIAAGSVIFESAYWRDPPLRSWLNGAANTVAQS